MKIRDNEHVKDHAGNEVPHDKEALVRHLVEVVDWKKIKDLFLI